jgi:hypothetical protein
LCVCGGRGTVEGAAGEEVRSDFIPLERALKIPATAPQLEVVCQLQAGGPASGRPRNHQSAGSHDKHACPHATVLHKPPLPVAWGPVRSCLSAAGGRPRKRAAPQDTTHACPHATVLHKPPLPVAWGPVRSCLSAAGGRPRKRAAPQAGGRPSRRARPLCEA